MTVYVTRDHDAARRIFDFLSRHPHVCPVLVSNPGGKYEVKVAPPWAYTANIMLTNLIAGRLQADLDKEPAVCDQCGKEH
jgi:hypothetical protein